MARRPPVVPVFATAAAPGGVVEPASLVRQLGFQADRRPPAPWINWQFLHIGNWIDFLRGPNASQWTRCATPGSLGGDSLRMVIGDNATLNDDHILHRFVAVDTSGNQQLWSSVDGYEWLQRALVGLAVGEHPQCIGLSASRWVIGTAGTAAKIWTTRPDGYPSYATLSAIYDDSLTWNVSTIPAVGITSVDGIVSGQVTYTVAIVTAPSLSNRLLVSSLNATGFLVATLSVAPTGQFNDAVWSGTAWVAVTSAGEVYRTTDAGAIWTKLGASFAAHTYKLASNGAGVVLAVPYDVASGESFYVSTDHGASWASVAGPTHSGHFGAIRFLDGQFYLASNMGTPFEAGFPLHVSVDPMDPAGWLRLPMTFSETGFSGLHDIAYAQGGLVAVGKSFEAVSQRAQDLAPVPWSGGQPIQLHDAAYLQGTLVDTAVPADGDHLVFVSDRWTVETWAMTTATRDAIVAPREGRQIYNTTTKKLNFYDGTAWRVVTST
jgi:hypothetical protein